MQMMKGHARRCRSFGSSLHSTASLIFLRPMNSAFVTARHRNQLSARRHLPGCKVNKERATFLVRTNVDGSESLPPLLVDRAHRLRCFGRVEEEVLNFEYDYGGRIE